MQSKQKPEINATIKQINFDPKLIHPLFVPGFQSEFCCEPRPLAMKEIRIYSHLLFLLLVDWPEAWILLSANIWLGLLCRKPNNMPMKNNLIMIIRITICSLERSGTVQKSERWVQQWCHPCRGRYKWGGRDEGGLRSLSARVVVLWLLHYLIAGYQHLYFTPA